MHEKEVIGMPFLKYKHRTVMTVLLLAGLVK